MAPFGQDDLGTLRSVFEMGNVRKGAIFLDTQCEYLDTAQLVHSLIRLSQTVCRHPLATSSLCAYTIIASSRTTASQSTLRADSWTCHTGKRREQGPVIRYVDISCSSGSHVAHLNLDGSECRRSQLRCAHRKAISPAGESVPYHHALRRPTLVHREFAEERRDSVGGQML